MIGEVMRENIVDTLEKKSLSQELEGQYHRDGITKQFIDERVTSILDKYKNEKGLYPPWLKHEDAFYINSSDCLHPLHQFDVADKEVMSVVANGDFLEIFIDGDARNVELYDISWSAILWCELKFMGLRYLTFEEYKKMFCQFDIRKNKNRVKPLKRPLFDKGLYMSMLRDYLSEEARHLFDKILTEEMESLFFVPDTNENGFARSREFNFVRDVLKNKSRYKQLQGKALKKEYSVRKIDINDRVNEDEQFPEFVFISNIGYEPRESVRLAKEMIQRGAKRVLCTWSQNQFSTHYGVFEDGGRFYKQDGELVHSGSLLKFYKFPNFKHEMEPEAMIKVVDIGDRSDIQTFNCLIEISVDDNPQWFMERDPNEKVEVDS